MTLWAVFCTIAVTFGLAGSALTIVTVWLAVIIRAFIRERYVSGCLLSAWLLYAIFIFALFLPFLSAPMTDLRPTSTL